MTTIDDLPFGAETPDELLVAYANASLPPAERAEVDRWLAVHTAWTSRLNAYRAIGGAVRLAAGGADAPAIGALRGLWAAMDAQPEARPVPALPPLPLRPDAGAARAADRRPGC